MEHRNSYSIERHLSQEKDSARGWLILRLCGTRAVLFSEANCIAVKPLTANERTKHRRENFFYMDQKPLSDELRKHGATLFRRRRTRVVLFTVTMAILPGDRD